jgi:hypothetical protein
MGSMGNLKNIQDRYESEAIQLVARYDELLV